MILDEPDLDFVILADRAEVVNGKLYMMGGGWEAVGLRRPGDTVAFSVALGIRVPWATTNTELTCRLHVEDADGGEIASWSISFRTGRPPALAPGTVQRVMFALPAAVVLPSAGTYAVVCTLGDSQKRQAFQAHLVTIPGAGNQQS